MLPMIGHSVTLKKRNRVHSLRKNASMFDLRSAVASPAFQRAEFELLRRPQKPDQVYDPIRIGAPMRVRRCNSGNNGRPLPDVNR
jgi:hypothetical protein